MKIVVILTFLLLAQLVTGQVEKLDIGGAIRIGNSKRKNPKPGTIRWTGLNFEGWYGAHCVL